MTRIVQAINAMINHEEKISEVRQGTNSREIFFMYDDKYKWSINKGDDDHYYLCFYPGQESIQMLASWNEEWQDYNSFITYSTKELKTRESFESMAELYTLVKEKRFGIDDALNDIIKDIPF